MCESCATGASDCRELTRLASYALHDQSFTSLTKHHLFFEPSLGLFNMATTKEAINRTQGTNFVHAPTVAYDRGDTLLKLDKLFAVRI